MQRAAGLSKDGCKLVNGHATDLASAFREAFRKIDHCALALGGILDAEAQTPKLLFDLCGADLRGAFTVGLTLQVSAQDIQQCVPAIFNPKKRVEVRVNRGWHQAGEDPGVFVLQEGAEILSHGQSPDIGGMLLYRRLTG